MGRVPDPHSSPTAPEDRSWNWHGTEETRKTDELLERGWDTFANAHAWYDPQVDEGNDGRRRSRRTSCPTTR